MLQCMEAEIIKIPDARDFESTYNSNTVAIMVDWLVVSYSYVVPLIYCNNKRDMTQPR